MFDRIASDAFEAMQMEAGMLLKTFNPANPADPADEDILCATTGGITVSAVASYSDFGEDVDNCPANLKELKHLDSWECSMQFTALEMKPGTVRMSLGAADIDGTDETKIIPRADLKQSDFQTLWWVGKRVDGGFVAVKIFNALSTGGFSLKTNKDGKGNLSVTITGHVSKNAQSVVPMEFYATGPNTTAVTDEAVGTGDGTTKVFTLDHLPYAEVLVKVGGTAQVEGNDYNINGDTITFAVAPAENAAITASYSYLNS